MKQIGEMGCSRMCIDYNRRAPCVALTNQLKKFLFDGLCQMTDGTTRPKIASIDNELPGGTNTEFLRKGLTESRREKKGCSNSNCAANRIHGGTKSVANACGKRELENSAVSN